SGFSFNNGIGSGFNSLDDFLFSSSASTVSFSVNPINAVDPVAGYAPQGTQITVTFPSGAATTQANADQQWSVPNPGLNDEHGQNVTVVATDPDGNVIGESVVEIDALAPEAPIVNPVSGDGTISGTAEPGSTVSIVLPDDVVLETQADENGEWSVTNPGLEGHGGDAVVVTARDEAGNVSESTISPVYVGAPNPVSLEVTSDGGISATGEVTVAGVIPGATWEYSLDGGETWIAGEGDGFILQDGNYADGDIWVRQIDPVGNVSDPSSVGALVVDTIAPAAPTIEHSDGSYSVEGVEVGALVEYSTDGGDTWSTDAPEAVEGENAILVRQTDEAGNTSGSSELTFTLDTSAPDAPSIALDSDTGTVTGTTNDGSYSVADVEAGALVEYSTDGGDTWTTDAPEAVEGENAILVRQTDEAGNTSGSSELTFTLDTSVPDAPSIALDTDTGSVNGITNDGSYSVTGAETGALVEFSTDGGDTWITDAPDAIEGENAILVRQTDEAGNTSGSSELTFTLDTSTSDAPTLTLDADTGSVTGITNDGSYSVTGVETGALVEYSTDGGDTWTADAPEAIEGENAILVRQTDEAGNTSDSNTLTFTLDTSAPDAPTLTLDSDTGTVTGITNDGSYSVTGAETGALVEYSTDGGDTWTTDAPEAVEGENAILVRQTDESGNTSGSSELTFTLDTSAPDAPTLTLDSDTGTVTGITNDGGYSVAGVETG
ncbi:MAG: Ig-like domain-containing protein, partial [Natronospirillum sp.]